MGPPAPWMKRPHIVRTAASLRPALITHACTALPRCPALGAKGCECPAPSGINASPPHTLLHRPSSSIALAGVNVQANILDKAFVTYLGKSPAELLRQWQLGQAGQQRQLALPSTSSTSAAAAAGAGDLLPQSEPGPGVDFSVASMDLPAIQVLIKELGGSYSANYVFGNG